MSGHSVPLRFVLVLGVLVGARAADAQSRAYLKLANVPGESAQRAGEIDLVSFRIGVSRTPAGKGGF